MHYLTSMVYAFTFCSSLLPVTIAERPPNIVPLFSDDAGYADFGFVEGADPKLAVLTPNITRLVRSGTIFTQAYVSGPVCGPSRAGLLTGRYQQRFGHEMNMPIGSELGMPGGWKLLHFKDPPRKAPELYNLATDRSERIDLAAHHPERVAAMMKELEAWNAQLVKPLFRDFSAPNENPKNQVK